MIADTIRTALRAVTPGPLNEFWYSPVGAQSTAGVDVTADKAMAVSVVFACIRVLAETLGTLPFRVYRRTGLRSKQQAPEHPLWRTLHTRPNRWQTSLEWREMGMAHLALRGNYYNRIVLNEDGQLELVPLAPDRVEVEQLPSRRLRYRWRDAEGQWQYYTQDEVYHVRGLSLNGLTGVSILEYARNAIGLAISQETHGASLFKNGGQPTFWIKRPKEAGRWTPDARKNFRAGWRALHAGAENAHNPPILEDGMELQSLGLTNQDSQWIESRAFEAVEICRFFRVPPHLVGILDKATFSNIEQQSLEFVLYTMLPWAIRWEQAADRDLVVEDDHYTKLVLDGLLRGDMRTRYESHNIALQGGWKTRNEVRELEDLDPIEGGDTPLEPTNMQPAGGGPDQNEQGGQPGKGRPKEDTAASVSSTGETAEPGPDPTPAETPVSADTGVHGGADLEAVFGPLVADAAARIAAAEVRGLERRAERAADDRGRWAAWVEEFYANHREYCGRTLAPLADGIGQAMHRPIDALAIAERLSRANQEVLSPSADIPRLVKSWSHCRAGQIARWLREEFFHAV